MKRKIILFFTTLLLIFPSVANGEYKISRNYLKLTEVGTNHSEHIEIKNTDLTKKSNVDSLINEVNGRENFDEISIASVPKFKGGAEEIYEDYANSVVLIGNKNKWATGSGFFIKHNGLKIITNWHVVEGTKNVDVWLKPKKKKEVGYLLNNVDSYKGKVVKTNKKKDLAMIEIKGISSRIKPVTNFGSISKILEEHKINIDGEIGLVASNIIKVTESESRDILTLLEQLDNHDDVQKVHTNFEVD